LQAGDEDIGVRKIVLSILQHVISSEVREFIDSEVTAYLRSRIDAKMVGESASGRQRKSTVPSLATNAVE
jgi:hypothetical protein